MNEVKNYCSNCKFWNQFMKHKHFGVCDSQKRSEAKKTSEEVTPENYTCFYHEKK